MAVAIYALADPRTGIVGYVGRSAAPEARHRQHRGEPGGIGEPSPTGSLKHRWLRELRAAGCEPQLVILDTALDVPQSKALEMTWIAHYRTRGEATGNGHDRPRGKLVGPRRIVPAVLMGQILREARRDAGLTLAAVGVILGVSDSAVSRWESGSREIPSSALDGMRKLAARRKKAMKKQDAP
jgi:hypothetical protein